MLLVFLIAYSHWNICLGQRTFQLYSDIKDDIGVVPYSPAQRLQVAQSIRSMMTVTVTDKIYVNRQSKIDSYENQFHDIDPVPRVNQMIAEAESLDDLKFHYKFVDIYASLRDLHTLYHLPGPHKCVILRSAILFDVVQNDGLPSIIASGYQSKEILDLSPNANMISIGDELISISRMPINDYIQSRKFNHSAANESGSLRATLTSLSRIVGSFEKLPPQDHTIFEFRNSKGILYGVNLPWVSIIDTKCWVQSKRAMGRDIAQVQSFPTKLLSEQSQQNIAELNMKAIVRGKSRFQQTADSGVQWKIYKPDTRNMGVIVIKSFKPDFNDIDRVINILRKLLLTELADTLCILIDVRSNTGGSMKMVDMIPQLFKPDIKLGTYRMLANKINENIVDYTNDRKWIDALYFATPDAEFTSNVTIRDSRGINRLGQAYSRPVGVFTNGNCYSACDLLAANMKDNNIATIFGEDFTTGGGGAVSAKYTSFLRVYARKLFPDVPLVKLMPLGAQDFSVGWKQVVRLDGSLIEDIGIPSDFVIKPILADFTSLANSQLDRISSILIQEGIDRGTSGTIFKVLPEGPFTFVCGQEFHFQISTIGFKSIVIRNEEDTIIDRFTSDDNSRLRLLFKLNPFPCVSKIYRFNFQGLNPNGDIVFSTWRSAVATPKKTNYLTIQSNTSLDLRLDSNYIGLYNNALEVDGWRQHKSILTVDHFNTDIDSTVSFYLHCNQSYKVKIKVNSLISTNTDYFYIQYIRYGSTPEEFDTGPIALSNEFTFIDRSIDLSSGDYQILFHLKSAQGGVGAAQIESIIVE